MHDTTSRRQFLKKAVVGTSAAMGFPCLVSAKALGLNEGVAASNRIGIAHIGIGGRGSGLMRGLLGNSDVQVLAVCDTDCKRLDSARERVHAAYSKSTGAAYQGCDAYGDFEEVLARPDIDGVVVATPDHWHAIVIVKAAMAGKDIYSEKPFAASISGGRAAANAVKQYGRVFQTGSHERSNKNCRYACELVRNGRIGKLQTIRTYLPTGSRRSGATGPQPVPEGFDYNRWLGPAPYEPYHPQRCHGSFRWIMDYSDGELTDRGAHVNDIALLGAGPFLKGPIEIEGRGKCIEDPLYDVPYEYHVEFNYANGIQWILDSSGQRGIRFEGTDGWIFVAIHGGALSASDPALLRSTIQPGEVHLGRSRGHGQDWIDAMRSRGPTMAPAEDGHRTSSFCHLSLIAVLLQRKLVWDTEREEFINDSDANSFAKRTMRAPWKI